MVSTHRTSPDVLETLLHDTCLLLRGKASSSLAAFAVFGAFEFGAFRSMARSKTGITIEKVVRQHAGEKASPCAVRM